VDGQSEEFDLIVCATGYHVSFPFLPPGLVPVKGSVAKLYGDASRGVQKSLHHRDVATALRIRARGYAGNGPNGANDAGAGPDGAADRAGHERVGSAASYNPFDRSTRRVARHSKGKRLLPLLLWKEKKLRKKLAPRGATPPVFPSKPARIRASRFSNVLPEYRGSSADRSGVRIGRALAQQLAAAGSALALADIDEPALSRPSNRSGARAQRSALTWWTSPRKPAERFRTRRPQPARTRHAAYQ